MTQIFGKNGPFLSRKNLGKKPIPGQGESDGVPQPELSRQQRRLFARLGYTPRKTRGDGLPTTASGVDSKKQEKP